MTGAQFEIRLRRALTATERTSRWRPRGSSKQESAMSGNGTSPIGWLGPVLCGILLLAAAGTIELSSVLDGTPIEIFLRLMLVVIPIAAAMGRVLILTARRSDGLTARRSDGTLSRLGGSGWPCSASFSSRLPRFLSRFRQLRGHHTRLSRGQRGPLHRSRHRYRRFSLFPRSVPLAFTFHDAHRRARVYSLAYGRSRFVGAKRFSCHFGGLFSETLK
jgi:hypothetical protein